MLAGAFKQLGRMEGRALAVLRPILLPRWSGGLLDHWLWALPGFDCSLLQAASLVELQFAQVDMSLAVVKMHPLVCQGAVLSSYGCCQVACTVGSVPWW